MIVIGTEDIGPLKYLMALDEWLIETHWIRVKTTKLLLNNKNIISKNKLSNASIIITGTSLGASIDKKLIKIAKKAKIPSITIIDHWSWYKKRFELDGEMILPDYIIVNDEYARDQALADNLPEEKIFVGGHPHLEKLAKMKLTNIDAIRWREKNNLLGSKIILFITEELKDYFLPGTNDYLGYDEFDVLNNIIEVLPDNAVLIIKNHPEEEKDKYNKYTSEKIYIRDKISIDEMVHLPDLIIGMASMLLIELAMYRDDIISYRPNARKSFYGEEIGATHPASTKKQLMNYINNPPKLSSLYFRKKYEGSGKRISKFLHSLI